MISLVEQCEPSIRDLASFGLIQSYVCDRHKPMSNGDFHDFAKTYLLWPLRWPFFLEFCIPSCFPAMLKQCNVTGYPSSLDRELALVVIFHNN